MDDRSPRQVADLAAKSVELGPWMHDLLVELFPICRSLAAPGNRETLDIVSRTVPLTIEEVPSGTKVYDWTVPQEWAPKGGEISGEDGRQYARFEENNLHIVNGSIAIDEDMSLDQLQEHIYSLPDQPDLIPYVTSYYHPHWGFCMRDDEKKSLPEGRYRVRIDADRYDGHLIYGEAVLKGESDREILISTYICHPSMANDNLSGVVVACGLYRILESLPDRKYTYRFVFAPETIGSLCWLSRNEDRALNDVHAGLVLSCIGDSNSFSYKKSRRGDAEIDRVVESVMGAAGTLSDFFPNSGSDERQFCSPGFNMPVGMLSRTYPGQWPYYHTSGDTADRVTQKTLGESLEMVLRIILGLEMNAVIYDRTNPFGEPMLSRHNLYHAQNLRMNTDDDKKRESRGAMMWLLNLADGTRDLTDISLQSGASLLDLGETAAALVQADLLKGRRK